MPLSTDEPESIGAIGGYTLVRRLGSGGMGVVHLARSASGRHVAVKVVHAQYAQDEEFRTRFRQEIAAARRVSGAFTAPVVDADPDAELPWMATLYVPGRTLDDIVAEQGPLGGPGLRTLALGLVEALRDIHQAGVVHRDLKPSNVLMADDGPRVIDFGISRAADNEALTVTGRLIGTPPFMSPEQFASPRDVTAASDVFSLGSLLVYAATGNRPFDGGSPYMTGYQVVHEQPALSGVAEPLLGIVVRCLAKDPADRPQLAELHRLFRSLPDLADAPAVSGPPAAPGHRRRSRGADDSTAAGRWGRGRRPRRLVLLGAALAVTGVSVSAYHLMSSARTTEAGPGASASAPSAPALPTGWRPWQTNLTRAVRDDPLSVNVDSVEAGCVSAGSALYCAGTGFTVARLDAASGRVAWRYGNSAQAAERPLGVRDGIVYTYERPDEVNADQRVIALDADTGKRVWTRDVDASHRVALFDGGVLTVSDTANAFVALDLTSGRELWRLPAKSSAGSLCSPVVLGDAPYGLCADANEPGKGPVGLLRLAPDAGTARELDPVPVGATPLGTLGGWPLFVLPKSITEYESDDGRDESYTTLLRVNPVTGTATRVFLEGAPRGTPTVIDGTVYFVRPDGTVTAVKASNGARLWQRDAQIENLSAPVRSPAYGTVYFANRYGRLLALDQDTGAVRWTTAKLDDPGTSAENTIPSVLLVKDAIVAVAGETAFSVNPVRETAGETVN
ncbi:serine/threonine-protein kinase [Streptomyces sp. DG2A-72]|uniref:serine/threonine-protein kinase n=1 Tax=Streptomyces sp. DG2A-72 TaxID=3051386 RepID=UPI00265C55EC|nr:serine/threonine-protein kinase [Streptomyces sp. DG2A-72]MDO0935815.1 serine/threonine-protein kinase [Streptomyces sp. DG2A-72]